MNDLTLIEEDKNVIPLDILRLMHLHARYQTWSHYAPHPSYQEWAVWASYPTLEDARESLVRRHTVVTPLPYIEAGLLDSEKLMWIVPLESRKAWKTRH
jgi:hypothetical protein